jgi:hypothetical protein
VPDLWLTGQGGLVEAVAGGGDEQRRSVVPAESGPGASKSNA